MPVNPFESKHYRAVARLNPLPMDAVDYAVCKELDRALDAADQAHQESFVSTCTLQGTMTRWEDVFSLPGTGTEQERRQAIIAAANRQWGIAAKHYRFIAEQMGFTVVVGKPNRLFRAGLSRAGERCYTEDEAYIWPVSVNASKAACGALIKAFEDQKIPFTEIRWTFND